ncbi:MAG: hypothetical protein DRN96_07190 [Thermoproteota archaeon]|nr:MAG: hypothetical protein DRN96_07190 [Candidatus Korarchaeota archaeon]
MVCGWLLELCSGLIRHPRVGAVAVFGSATRPEDYVRGVSDVDVLVVSWVKLSFRERLRLEGECRCSLVQLTPGELGDVFELGHPLAFLLYRDSLVLYDSGVLKRAIREPEVTEYTLEVLKRSAVVAYCLSLERYFHGEYVRAVSHSYHALRHAVRWLSLRMGLGFPASDREVADAAHEARSTFLMLRQLRRRKVSRGECKLALDAASSAIEELTGGRLPRVGEVEHAICSLSQPELSYIHLSGIREIRAVFYTREGIVHLVFEYSM